MSILTRTAQSSTNINTRAYANVKGFTLLEVLLAIGITAMIGLGSWQILHSAIRASESTQARLQELNALQKTMLIISRDLRQIISRSIRDEYGDYQAALTTKNEFYVLEFSRVGWRNPMDDPRSGIQRVAYELSDNTLVRHYWNVLDRSQDTESISRDLIENVNDIKLRFLNEKGGWVDQWPSSENNAGASSESVADPRKNDNQLPKGVEISFDLEQFGKIKRVYEIVSSLDGIAIQTDTNANDNDTSNGNNNNANRGT